MTYYAVAVQFQLIMFVFTALMAHNNTNLVSYGRPYRVGTRSHKLAVSWQDN